MEMYAEFENSPRTFQADFEEVHVASQETPNALKYVPQNLTPEQQAQARQNIRAIELSQAQSISKSMAYAVRDIADATAGITTGLLDALYAPAYYSTLAGAVADLNGKTIGMNAEPTAENAVCALYEDFDGNTCLVLLADVESTEFTTFTESVIFKINGHTLSLPDSAKIKFSGDNSVIDGRVEGSCITKKAKVISSNLPVIDMTGTNTQILSVVFDMTIESATAMIAAILARSECVTDGIKISVKVNGGNATIYNAMTQSGGVLKMRKSKIVLNSLSVGTAAGVKAQSSGKGLYLDQCEITVDQEDGTVCGIADSMPEFSSFYDTDITCCTRNGSAYSLSKDTGEANIDKCKLYSSATTGSAVSLNLHTQNSKVSAQKSVFFSDGTTGSVNDNEKAISIGVTNYGHLTLDDCAVYGTHSGMQCSEGSTTIVNGGVYEGVGHGGLYLACVDGNFYGQNATFRAAPYRGKFKDLFNYSRTYLVAAVYIGGGEDNNNIKAYVDNCIFDGSGPCIYESSDGKPQGAEPIRFRGSLGEQNNAIYASNCTFMGDGEIRFINDTHRLYLGFGNRLLCEATIPACVDSTTYAGKVFTNYEE